MCVVTETEAYEILREALSDDVMKQERMRVIVSMERKVRDLLAALGLEATLDEEKTAERLALFKEFHHIPGDHLWQAMQFVFRVARDGGDESDRQLQSHYLDVIYRTLFTSPMVKTPAIPEQWWETPLGIACKVVEYGISSCMDTIVLLQQSME